MTPVDLPYASLGRRLLALVLDGMILFLPCAIGTHIVPVIGGLVVLFLYGPILESSEVKATLGKYLVGIQVVDLSGRRISLRAALVRNILKFVSTVLAFIGFLFALFSDRRQTLHDLLAETLVVYGRNEGSLVDAWVASFREMFESGQSAIGVGRPSLSKLERLQALRDRGTLTEEEFQEQKRKILNN